MQGAIQVLCFTSALLYLSTAQPHATSSVSYNGLLTLSHVDACDLHRQRCCTFHGRCTRPSATVPSPLPLRESGTCYHWRSRHCRHCRLSSVHWRRNCFTDRMTTHTSGNSSIDTSLICDIYCGPEVLFETSCRGLVTLHWAHVRCGHGMSHHFDLFGLGGQWWSVARCLASGQSSLSCQCEHTFTSHVKNVWRSWRHPFVKAWCCRWVRRLISCERRSVVLETAWNDCVMVELSGDLPVVSWPFHLWHQRSCYDGSRGDRAVVTTAAVCRWSWPPE